MDRRSLLFFTAAAEELHFGRAARRMNATQPALSQQVARLEAQLGVALFDRAHRRVTLTEAGRVFLAEAHAILRQMDVAGAMARRAAEGATGRLALGFVDAAAFTVLSRLVSAFHAAHPQVHLILQEMISSEQAEALRAGRLDIALMRPLGLEPDLRALPVHREPYVVAMPAAHPLAASPAVPLAALRAEPLIIAPRPKSAYLEAQFRPAFARLGFAPTIAQEVNPLHAIIGLVGAGLGLSIVPDSIRKLGQDRVVFRPLAGAGMPMAQLVVAWNDTRKLPLPAQRFIAFSQALAKGGRAG